MNAWQELSAVEYDAVWARFVSAFAFRPSVARWPAIRELIPSVTWSIAPAFGPERERLEDDLNAKVLTAFKRCTRPDQRLYALDWQHPGYWLWPHRFTDAMVWDAWKVPVLPDGDYYIFLSEDFAVGLFGHPWEQTLCAFGPTLLAALEDERPALLTQVVRRNGSSP